MYSLANSYAAGWRVNLAGLTLNVGPTCIKNMKRCILGVYQMRSSTSALKNQMRLIFCDTINTSFSDQKPGFQQLAAFPNQHSPRSSHLHKKVSSWSCFCKSACAKIFLPVCPWQQCVACKQPVPYETASHDKAVKVMTLPGSTVSSENWQQVPWMARSASSSLYLAYRTHARSGLRDITL